MRCSVVVYVIVETVTTQFARLVLLHQFCIKQNPKTMSKSYTFCVHDESVNTYGFRMLTSGANLEEFRKNPNVFYNHDDWDMPIGRAENIRTEGGRILMDIVFDEEDDKSRKIQGKVDRGFLRMTSIGTWPPEEVSEDTGLKIEGQTGVTITKWTLREVSICPIGSNHNALAMFDRHSGKRIDLNDRETLIRLMDDKSISINHKTPSNMSYLTQMLKLSDSASDQAVQEAVQGLITLRDNLQAENASLKTEKQTLQNKVTAFETAEKESNKQKAITLVDAAVKDGRIDAKGKESWLEDFADNFAKAEVRLSSISARQAVSPQVRTGSQASGNVQLADMTFKEILEKDMLKELKKDKDLYREKFYATYGKYPE